MDAMEPETAPPTARAYHGGLGASEPSPACGRGCCNSRVEPFLPCFTPKEVCARFTLKETMMKISENTPRFGMNSGLAMAAVATVAALWSVGCSQPFSPATPTLNSVSALGSSANGPASKAGGTTEVPFKGSLNGDFTFVVEPPPSTFAAVRLNATGVASHVGRFTLVAPHRVNLATDPAEGAGSFELIAANGDTLTGRLEGLGTLTAPPDGFTIVETYTITGGTGRFAGATGRFTAERSVNLTTLVTSGSFEGTISSPGSANP